MKKKLIPKVCLCPSFLKYELNTDLISMSKTIVSICNLLNKGTYIIEVFEKDPINSQISARAQDSKKNKNFLYYFCNDLQFLTQTEFTKIRFFCICTADQINQKSLSHASLISNSSFSLCWDNYIETSELIVKKKEYSHSILKMLSEF